MKQKVVIKVSMSNPKSRSKALTIVVGIPGVESAALQGEEKNQIEVIGEVDSVELTRKLRKNIGHAELVTVGPFDQKKEEKKYDPKIQPIEWWPYCPCNCSFLQY